MVWWQNILFHPFDYRPSGRRAASAAEHFPMSRSKTQDFTSSPPSPLAILCPVPRHHRIRPIHVPVITRLSPRRPRVYYTQHAQRKVGRSSDVIHTSVYTHRGVRATRAQHPRQCFKLTKPERHDGLLHQTQNQPLKGNHPPFAAECDDRPIYIYICRFSVLCTPIPLRCTSRS